MKDEWRPMVSAPTDGTGIEVKLSTGRIVYAEYWEGPPGRERDWGGWAYDSTASFCDGAFAQDGDAE